MIIKLKRITFLPLSVHSVSRAELMVVAGMVKGLVVTGGGMEVSSITGV